MKSDHRFEAIDKAALHNALLALRTCPRCRGDLQPVALCTDVYGCPTCRETWHLPRETAPFADVPESPARDRQLNQWRTK